MAPLSRLLAHIKRGVSTCASAAALTYCSLLVPGRVSAVCSQVGEPEYCLVLAYGFPLPFLADSQALSPVGSVARDPLSLLVGQDDLLWPRLALDGLFWLLVTVAARRGWRRWRTGLSQA